MSKISRRKRAKRREHARRVAQSESTQTAKRSKSKPGKASNYIGHLPDLFRQQAGTKIKIVPYFRVSSYDQKRAHNDQEALRKLVRDIEAVAQQYGVEIEIVGEAGGRESGWAFWKSGRPHLAAAVKRSKERNAIIVAPSTERLVRNKDYRRHGTAPTVEDFEMLTDFTAGAALATVIHPDESSGIVRSHETKRGQQAKGRKGGRPPKKKPGWLRERFKTSLSTVLILDKIDDSATTIRKILTNRSVLGEYQPHRKVNGKRVREGEPQAGFFPEIIEPETFFSVQQMFAKSRRTGGQTGKARNVLRHLVKCAYCGGSMTFVDKGKPPKGGTYLVCENGQRNNGCGRRSIRYDECETLVLEQCHNLRPDQILPDEDERTRQCRQLAQRIEGRNGKLEDIGQQIANLSDQITRTKSAAMRDRYEAKILELDASLSDVKKQLANDEHALRVAEQASQSFTEWKRNLATLQKAVKGKDPGLRIQLNAHLRELIDKIEVFTDGHGKEKEYDNVSDDGDTFGEYIDALVGDERPRLLRDKQFRAFVRYATDRRMSKDGRFLRIHFKGGARRNVVPPNSLASGVNINGKGFDFVEPDLEQLYKQFAARNGNGLNRRKVVK